jgi:hypothetical protein
MDYKMLKINFCLIHISMFLQRVSDVGDENGKYINDGEVIPRQVELQHVG